MNFAHFDPYEFVVLSVVFGLVIVCWVVYTRRLRLPSGVGKEEGIAIAMRQREQEHAGKTGRIS
jgi:hypothetical protein